MEKYQIRNDIRKLRFLHGEMTQSDLAKKIGATRQTIIAIEKDKYSPSLDLAFRIAQAFDTPIGEVFWYEKVAETKQGH
jgi:putative transcriptional regulator